MKHHLTVCAALLLAVFGAQAASPKNAVLIDHSSTGLIESDAARALLAEGIPARVWAIYPAGKWGYVSQVAGGFTSGGVCVVTARVMMMQLTPTMKAMLFRPYKTATAYDAVPGATQEQCHDLARSKLQEAIQGVVASLVKT